MAIGACALIRHAGVTRKFVSGVACSALLGFGVACSAEGTLAVATRAGDANAARAVLLEAGVACQAAWRSVGGAPCAFRGRSVRASAPVGFAVPGLLCEASLAFGALMLTMGGA